MLIHIIAVGNRIPMWANLAIQDYCQRLQGQFALEITEIPIEKRSKSKPVDKLVKLEGDKILKRVDPSSFAVAMEVHGKPYTSVTLASEMEHILGAGQGITFMLGGPDGLSEAVSKRANAHWSLSTLTLPHSLARLLLVEQIYRVQTILNGHPYHK